MWKDFEGCGDRRVDPAVIDMDRRTQQLAISLDNWQPEPRPHDEMISPFHAPLSHQAFGAVGVEAFLNVPCHPVRHLRQREALMMSLLMREMTLLARGCVIVLEDLDVGIEVQLPQLTLNE